MTLGGLKVDDLVLVSKKGMEFIAVVTGRENGGVQFEPIDRRISYRQATAREIVGHWSKRANSRTPQVNRNLEMAA